MPVTFIGDIHGWIDRLERVLKQAQGELIFMGDLIDRGPDAPAVLERVHALCDEGRARCLLGNHEYALLHGLGVPRLGVDADPVMWEAWHLRFGGAAVLRSYRVSANDPAALQNKLGAHYDWMTRLPWLLEGDEGERHWLAVHAGLGDGELAPQLAELRLGWAKDDGAPSVLFNKTWAHALPSDIPAHWCIVSGHTPVRHALVTPQRLLCDTSGGMPDRPLSGIIWPEGRVITSG